jgi:transposase
MNRSTSESVRELGVGIDTARYGHQVAFLRDDKQPAAPQMSISESRSGYERLAHELERLRNRHPHAEIRVRIDAAGQYAHNLETFLRSLDPPLSVSLGEPKRNKDYCCVHYPKRKADPVESQAMARYAVVERPEPSGGVPPEFAALRRVASRLQAQVKQTTRLTNQLHETLSAVFPELATLVHSIAAEWVLTLLKRYPTPQRIAAARLSSLVAIRFLQTPKAQKIREAARTSVGSLRGQIAEALVRGLVEQLQASLAGEVMWKKLLEKAYDSLPHGDHRCIPTITGIGKLTAAAIVATAIDVDRFTAPEKLVGYYGIFPQEFSSGVDKNGQPNPAGKKRMCRKGNDLVRGLLWNCAKCAASTNPAVRALYARLMSKGVRGDVAFGYCMTKLLHLVYAVWKTGKPFDPNHYHWDTTAANHAPQAEAATEPGGATQAAVPSPADPLSTSAQKNAAGLKEHSSEGKEVTAAATVIEGAGAVDQLGPTATDSGQDRWIDFAHLRSQVTIEQVLKHLGLFDQLRRTAGSRSQYRGTCPIHVSDGKRRRSFSVNLDKQAFRCFYPECGAQGNVLDLWAAVRGLPLRQAGLDLMDTFHLSPTPEAEQTEKRNPLKKNPFVDRETSRPVRRKPR